MSSHELDAPPWLRVESTIMATARAIRQSYDQRFNDLDLNLSEASVLAYVAEHGALSQTQIAKSLGLGRAATGALIDVLEDRALVQRQTDPDDRRVWLVEITITGKELVEEVYVRDQILREQLRNGITRQERQQLAAVLVRLGNNLASVLAEEIETA
ncbi:MAG: MarR family transcriptional regulator [Acidimicrobiales bacterium]|nr:MarR family transcriptional regulator [Acidimicrobiales bacterium]